MNSRRNGSSQPFGRWLWLFPLSQLLHVLEESWQGYAFHVWLRGSAHAEFSRPQVHWMHLAFVVAMLVSTLVASTTRRAGWIVPALALLVLLNAASHLGVAAVVPSAASGTISSLLIWLPLGGFALRRAAQHLVRRELWGGMFAGVLVQVVLTWLAAFA